ncbi:MAG TPA: hypothetical protein VHA37_04435 [Candidatus Saccharimonadales bacterium]|nr:hypothetical protein [Candidatus Saccharimonadales bacterium]
MNAGTCRQCGCTETEPCLVMGGTCSWVEPDLCSACKNKELRLNLADLGALRLAPPVAFQMDAIQGFLLLGALHLVCRHPDFDGMARQVVEALAEGLEKELSLTPGLQAIILAGRDPKQDVPEPRRIILPGE